MIIRGEVIIIETKEFLINYSEQQRLLALKKFHIIQPYIEKEISLNQLSEKNNISIRTLRLWIAMYRKDGLIGLIKKERSDLNTMQISNEVKKEVKQIFLKNKHLTISTIHRKVCAWCQLNTLPEPSYYQVRKIIQEVPNQLKYLAHEGSKEYINKYDIVHIREAEFPNEIWQADHTLLDIYLYDSNEELRRPWLTIIMDDFSRTIAGYFIDFEAPNIIKTALTLRQAIWYKGRSDWPICGIPENFYTDRGSDFTSIHLEQVALDVKMNLIFSRIGMPRGRGKIERFFRTINTMLLEGLPGYSKTKEAKSFLTEKEFIEIFEEWLFTVYHQRIHSSINEPPIQKWNQASFLPNIPDSLSQLDLLLLKIKKERKVHSDGIHVFGLRYMHTHLASFVSESVEIRYDPRDISEIRVFYNEQFLCSAVATNLETYSIGIKEIERERNKVRKQVSKDIKTTTISAINSLKEKDELNPNSLNKNSMRRYKNE